MTNKANTTYGAEVANSQANTLKYAINQSLLSVNTVLVCKIIAVNGLRYSLQILTNYIQANGTPSDAPLIYDAPAMQIVGNNAGVIIQYAVNDVVLVGFCQRDISTVKQNWKKSNPGSYRKFSLSDGIILGYLANTTPVVNITILPAGITVNSNGMPITFNPGASPVTVNGDLVVTGTATIDTDAVIDGLSFNAHKHAGTGTLIDSVTMAPISGNTAIPS